MVTNKAAVPGELADLPRWFRCNRDKSPAIAKRQAANWKTLGELNGFLGFELEGPHGTPKYALIDFDHVLDQMTREPVNDTARRVYDLCRKLLPGAYCEYSQSGTGLHYIVKPSTFDRNTLDIDCEEDGGRVKRKDRKHVEVFHNFHYVAMTGDTTPWSGDSIPAGAEADTVLYALAEMEGKDRNEEEKPTPEQEHDGEIPLRERALAMMRAIPPDITRSKDKWFEVSAAIKSCGVTFDEWHKWCSTMPDGTTPHNYEGEADCRRVWDSITRTSGKLARIGTLHEEAKKYGYREHAHTADEDFDWLDEEDRQKMEKQEYNPFAASVIDEILSEAHDYHVFSTWEPLLDDLLEGGFRSKTLILLGGIPGGGKTALLQLLMCNMAERDPRFSCLFYCFEMSAGQLFARDVLRMEGSGKLDDILKGNISDTAKAYYQRTGRRISYLPMETMSNNLDDVTSSIERGIKCARGAGYHVPFVVIDYMQLFACEKKDELETLKAAMQELKNIAKKYVTCVIATTALNREALKGQATLFSGRGSSSLEYGADAVLQLLPDKSTRNQGWLVVRKSRFCPSNQIDGQHKNGDYDCSIYYGFDKYGKFTFADVKPDEENCADDKDICT